MVTMMMMSQNPRNPKNPYAANAGYGSETPPRDLGGMGDDYDGRGERLSVMAVLSVLCSVPCCVVPGLGIVGIILGAVSLSNMKRSAGRLTGKPLAVAGVILGIIVTAVQLFALFGVLQGYTFFVNQMGPAADRVMTAAKAGDYVLARTDLSPAADADVTDERMGAFMAAAEAAHGEYQGASTRLSAVIESFGRVRGGSGPGFGGGGVADVSPVPVSVRFDTGVGLAWVLFDKDSLNRQQTKIADIVLVMPGGDVITLREDGPGVELARAMGMSVTPVEP